MSRPEVIRARVWLVVALAVSALVFTAWPEVDLWFSDLFRDPAEGFWLVTSPVLELWRDVVWNLSIIVFLMSLAGLAAALVGRQLLRVGARVWGFISLLYLLGPILLVNGLLKEHWGRARPANVTPLGGTQEFTPALIPTDVCDSNCSFVSGEGSAAVALGIAMLVLAPAVTARWSGATRAWIWAALVIPALTLVQRIVTGRHFLSDSVFATLFMMAIALFLLPILRGPNRPSR
jgi:membrane-associated phospholipid phosphatase